MPRGTDLLILGLGNVLCGDDGLGVLAVHSLERRYRVPARVSVLDGGTLGLSLLPHLQQAKNVILVDTVRCTGARPGSFVRLCGSEVPPAVRERLSPHQVGVADLLDGAAALGCSLAAIVLLGLVPADMSLHVGLSPAVARAAPLLERKIVAESQRLGYPLSRKPAHETQPVHVDAGRDLVAALGLRR